MQRFNPFPEVLESSQIEIKERLSINGSRVSKTWLFLTIKTKHMEFNHFVGIDISKGSFDVAVIKDNDISNAVSSVASNDPKGIAQLEEFLRRQEINLDQTLFCMEHTGIYCRLLSQYLTEQKYHVWLEMPVQIIRSLGVQRGKNDVVDARRIAEYACLKKDKSVLWEPPREVVLQIQDLLSLRDRLCESRKMLKQPIKEFKDTGHKQTAQLIESHCKSTLISLDKEIIQIEKELEKLINKDSNLKNFTV